MLAEDERHFLYLLKRLSYEVKHLELPDNVNEYFNLSFYEIAVYIRINIKYLK